MRTISAVFLSGWSWSALLAAAVLGCGSTESPSSSQGGAAGLGAAPDQGGEAAEGGAAPGPGGGAARRLARQRAVALAAAAERRRVTSRGARRGRARRWFMLGFSTKCAALVCRTSTAGARRARIISNRKSSVRGLVVVRFTARVRRHRATVAAMGASRLVATPLRVVRACRLRRARSTACRPMPSAASRASTRPAARALRGRGTARRARCLERSPHRDRAALDLR